MPRKDADRILHHARAEGLNEAAYLEALRVARRVIDYAKASRGAPNREAAGQALSDAGTRAIVERYGDDGLYACSVALDVLRAG